MSEQAKFLLENKHLFITGNPPKLEKIKNQLEDETKRIISIIITKQEGNYIEATFSI